MEKMQTPKKLTKSFKKPNHREKNITLEEIFPLAMTYCVEPKEANFSKIHNYISEYYNVTLTENKLKKCLDDNEKKFWIKNNGQTYRLKILEFDPTDDNDLTGMILNAIVACTEPKKSTVKLIKHYISDYHPEFNVHANSKFLLEALKRAVAKNAIIQISGTGMNELYQLKKNYRPSPSTLQGIADNDEQTNIENLDVTKSYRQRPSRHEGTSYKDESTDRNRRIAALKANSNIKTIYRVRATYASLQKLLNKNTMNNVEIEDCNNEDFIIKSSVPLKTRCGSLNMTKSNIISHKTQLLKLRKRNKDESTEDKYMHGTYNDDKNDTVKSPKKIFKKFKKNTKKVTASSTPKLSYQNALNSENTEDSSVEDVILISSESKQNNACLVRTKKILLDPKIRKARLSTLNTKYAEYSSTDESLYDNGNKDDWSYKDSLPKKKLKNVDKNKAKTFSKSLRKRNISISNRRFTFPNNHNANSSDTDDYDFNHPTSYKKKIQISSRKRMLGLHISLRRLSMSSGNDNDNEEATYPDKKRQRSDTGTDIEILEIGMSNQKNSSNDFEYLQKIKQPIILSPIQIN